MARKRVTMTVTVSVPAEFTAAEVRRDVRSRIKNVIGFYDGKFVGTDFDRRWVEMDIGTVKVQP